MEINEWLDKNSETMSWLMAHIQSPMPDSFESRMSEIESDIKLKDTAERLLADAESFLTQETARAILEVRRKHPDLSSEERKAFVKLCVKDVKRIYDGLDVTCRGIKDRLISCLNANRRT